MTLEYFFYSTQGTFFTFGFYIHLWCLMIFNGSSGVSPYFCHLLYANRNSGGP